MELINIKPCDNVFFGDGAKFKFGTNSFISSKSSPYPSVFFGAIFTAILSENNFLRTSFFEHANYDHEKILEINQVYLFNKKDGNVYIPAPKDLFVNSKGEIFFGKLKKTNNTICSGSFERILEVPEDKTCKQVNHKYIKLNNIYDSYLKKQKIRIKLKDESEIFIKNNKTGIGIEKSTKTVELGKLYKIEETEFLDNEDNVWSYIVEYKINKNYVKKKYKTEIIDLDKGYLKLGGENKVCRFQKVTNNIIEKFNEKKEMKNIEENTNKNILKIVFTSDAYFSKNIKEIFDADFKIIGMANGKPIYIGGYDMKSKNNGKGAPRRVYKGYSAGTIVFIEKLKLYKNNEEMIKMLNEKIKPMNSKGFNKYVVLEEDL